MDKIQFTVNGAKCYVGSEVSSDVTLVDYIRNYLELRGTKYMCREGGCGACIVSVVKTPGSPVVAVNSCLVMVMSCSGWAITTIEKVGTKNNAHPIQKIFAKNNATQCGYCTPGWIMAAYSLFKNTKSFTMLEIEKSFGSNICRCTGYRPILDSLKRFAKDSPNPVEMPDIEDLHKCEKSCSNCTKCPHEDDWCFLDKEDVPNILEIDLKDGIIWYRVSTVDDIFGILKKKGYDSYMLVAGNTAKGAYPFEEYPSTLIDISGVSELHGYQRDQNLLINGGITLTELIEIFDTMSEEDGFSYLKVLSDHLQLVAHIAVRNIGTIAGNLMLKHCNNEFPSDIFLLLFAVNAQVKIRNRFASKTVTLDKFLKKDMKGYVIMQILLPPLNSDYKIITYKIMPRAQNAHAIVNAAFVFRLRGTTNKVRETRIIYGGLKPPYVNAVLTEKYLLNKNLFEDSTLKGAVKILESELEAVENLPEPSPEYRKKLALGLFYKSLLSICPINKLSASNRSAAAKIREMRGVTNGIQCFDTDPEKWPLTQPVPKVEGLIQCTGEAPYTDDFPSFPREVFASFVLSTVATGTIVKIDATRALSHPDVIAFYTAEDIPGLNSFMPNDMPLYPEHEEVLCSGDIKYYNQPIGIIVAKSRHLADKIGKTVEVTYKNVKKPIVDIKEGMTVSDRVSNFCTIDAIDKGDDITKVIKGDTTIRHQYHFCMETHVCVTLPVEDGCEVYSSTQWLDLTQVMIKRALKLDSNSIDVYCRRVGGGFGIKATRSIQVAVACTLVAYKLNVPCRFIQALTTNIRAIGKRFPITNKYKLGVNESGVIQTLDYEFYEDNGYKLGEQIYLLCEKAYNNVYDKSRWNFKAYNVITDTPKNTWCRSPGSCETITMAEYMIQRISDELSLDPDDVRMANLDAKYSKDVREMLDTLKSKSDYVTRKAAVQQFNAENRWKKRGFKSSVMVYSPEGVTNLVIIISVYRDDGTVAITHAGIEMGQGINTRAIQIAAYFLNIPIHKIKIKGNNTIIGPNSTGTFSSVTNQNVGLGVQRACEEINKRLEPIRALMPDASWEELIKKAYDDYNINLQAQGYVSSTDGVKQTYHIFGVCFAEVEVDILTGESEVLRIDLIEDAGLPINPALDVGQIEGAFVMGMGYSIMENVICDPKTGEILTDRTWTYHVPQARDIPQDFRIFLRKNSYSVDLILGTKGISETPLCLSNAIVFAIREAIKSARLDSGIQTTEWFTIDGPCTPEKVCLSSCYTIEDFKY